MLGLVLWAVRGDVVGAGAAVVCVGGVFVVWKVAVWVLTGVVAATGRASDETRLVAEVAAGALAAVAGRYAAFAGQVRGRA